MGFELDQVYKTFFNPGEVTEIRVLSAYQRTSSLWEGSAFNGTVYGYFDNAELFAKAAIALDGLKPRPKGIYFTPNPCKPELLSRAANRLLAASKDRPLTSDQDISVIRWLLIDLDPARPSGISASSEELAAALKMGKEIVAFMTEFGFPRPVSGLSGNGYHLNYRLPDLPNEAYVSGRTNGLIARSLAALAAKFAGSGVKVDITVGNAARIWKLYGTWACKGDDTSDRPHRLSTLLKSAPEALALVPVSPIEALERLAALAPVEAGKGQQRPSASPGRAKSLPQDGDLGTVDVAAYLNHYGVAFKGTKQVGAATYYLLENCIFDPTHTDGKAAIVESPEPPHLTYACFHQSCNGKTWKDSRDAISGNASLARFCPGYDPNREPRRKKCVLRDRSGDESGASCELAGDTDTSSTLDVDFAVMSSIPTPEDVDPLLFFDLGPEGKRKRGSFVEMNMAQYLKFHLKPIYMTDSKFYKFEDGVWRVLPENVLKNVIARSLKRYCKAQHLDTSISVLGALVNREEKDWPIYPNLINCKNGMVNMEADYSEFTGKSRDVLLPHDPKYGSRVQLPVEYDPEATCPRWEQFLQEIFPTSPERAALLQLFMGYVLLPHTKYEKALFLYGNGANGKSTIISVLEKILGPENVCTVSLSELSRPFSVPSLQNKLLSVTSEMETKESQSTEVLKKVISGDTISGEQKFGKRIEFKTFAKVIFAMNNPPAVSDKTEGFKRKILVLYFDQRIPDSKMDRGLVDRLICEESAGIFAWMVKGAANLNKKNGFQNLGKIVENDTNSFMHTLNPLLDFLDEKTHTDPEASVPCDDFYQSYKAWCTDGGLRPMGKVQLNIQLLSAKTKVSRKKIPVTFGGTESRRHCYTGIRLLD